QLNPLVRCTSSTVQVVISNIPTNAGISTGTILSVAALGTLGAAQASPTPSPSDALKANSYADLLKPIPNAANILQALDEQAPAKSAEADVKVAQYYPPAHHHHHNAYAPPARARRLPPLPSAPVRTAPPPESR